MELTTGALLRRITETALSVSAHKLATIILDGIAWKDGYNGLERGTAAFRRLDSITAACSAICTTEAFAPWLHEANG